MEFTQPTRITTRRLRRVVPLFLLVLFPLLLTGCVTTTTGHGLRASTSSAAPSPTGTAGASPSPSVAFSDCSANFDLNQVIPADRLRQLSVQCGKVKVPSDYDNPASSTLSISLVRVHSSQQQKKDRIGSLLVNPGGPGGSGVILALSLAGTISQDVLDRFDLVGFDPRGVGLSSPLDCVTDAQKDQFNNQNPNVLTPNGFALAKATATTVAQSCSAKYGAALADITTIATAKDMEQIRIALAESSMNYLGYSYGTRLGSIYAHLYPSKVRVAVLDGAVNPDTDDITAFANQLAGFEAAFDQFAADCATKSPCNTLTNPRQTVYDLVAAANSSPIKSSKSGETRLAGSATVLTGVLSALYSSDAWPALGTALIQAKKGDSAGLFALADNYNERSSDGTYSNILEANAAISCNDAAPGPTDQVITATATQWATAYPMFGLWSAGSLFQCQVWQPNRHTLPAPTATGSKPILVIGTTHDPATPYASSAALATALGVGQVLSWDGQGHTAYLRGSSCIDEKVNTYLISGTLPPANTLCPA